MKMTRFRIQNYRSIEDSGWIDIDDIAVIVGKNESGKTSLLKALWKFNPFTDVHYRLEREWPRGRRKEQSLEKTVATVCFDLSREETADIEKIHESAKDIVSVKISKNYRGGFIYEFFPTRPAADHGVEWVASLLLNQLDTPPAESTQHFRDRYCPALKTLIEDVVANGGSKRALEKLPEIKSQLPSFSHPNGPHQGHPYCNEYQKDQRTIGTLNATIDNTIKLIEATPLRQVADFLHQRLPTFIYMDDYRSFCGTAQLDEVLERKRKSNLTPEDDTLIQIMTMAELNLENEVAKGGNEDREQRKLDMNDASITLTREIANRWSQKKYEVEFHADGQHFITFVKDVDNRNLIPLEERSKGFQWFFSFDMMFMHETGGNFANAVILLDEPGLHLHPAAQADLLKRIKAYAKANQLVYTTHLPFMIDFTRLDNIYVAEEVPGRGAIVHKNWATADKDARFTLQAALGLSWSQSLFVGQYNLVVEGVTDFWYLTTISNIFKEGGKAGLDDHLVVTPVGGASKVAYVGTILQGQNLKVAAFLDSDAEGKAACEQLVKQWLLKDKLVLQVGDILGVTGERTLEDLFDEGFYLDQVSAAYSAELAGKSIALPRTPDPILQRVEMGLKTAGVTNFNKGRVGKRIMTELSKKSLKDLPATTVQNFEKVFTAIDTIVQSWKSA